MNLVEKLYTKDDFIIIEGDGYPNIGWGNSELQCYKSKNVTFFDNNSIKIEAKKELCYTTQNRGYWYSSGKIQSKEPLSLNTPGRLEATISMPQGVGLWPAFWMLPANMTAIWPYGGEIDIMEVKGRLPNTYSGAIHYADLQSTHKCNYFFKDFSEGNTIVSLHQYALEWDNKEFRWYCDNYLVDSIDKEGLYRKINQRVKNPLEQDFNFILNLAIGGSFDSYRLPEDSSFPCEMVIKDIRYLKSC